MGIWVLIPNGIFMHVYDVIYHTVLVVLRRQAKIMLYKHFYSTFSLLVSGS